MSAKDRYLATGDFFDTPAWATRAIVPYIKEAVGASSFGVLDPCAGKGAILKTLRDESLLPGANHFGAIELQPKYALECEEAGFDTKVGDALKMDWGRPRLIVFNPPYHLAMQFVKAAIERMAHDGWTFALLRQAFAAGGSRQAFHDANPSDQRVLPRRPTFCISVVCKNTKKLNGKPVCGLRLRLAATDPRPKVCPNCGAKVGVSATDTSEYAWFGFGMGIGGRWSSIKIEKPKRGKLLAA